HPDWEARLAHWESQDQRRFLQVSAGVDFYSNDYLGLAQSEELRTRIREAEEEFALPAHGATGSRLLSGQSTLAEEVEAELARWLQADAALFFNSGYTANLAVLSTLPQKGDTILYDQYAHACLKDGARLSLAQRFSFRHNDLADLRKKLAKATGTVYVVVESVYSMDGDQAPLLALADLCDEVGAVLMVDEAHSTGLWGHQGSGLCVELGLTDRVPVRIHTFGKAMGTHGAAVAGHPVLREVLINSARSFIYTTAPPPQQWVAVREAVRFLAKHHPSLFQRLQNVILHFQESISLVDLGEGPAMLDSQSPIQGLIVPGNEACRAMAQKLQAAGFAVRPILSPTVPKGSERVRICLHSYNTEDELDRFAEALSSGK
ncbi:MAG: 8-amino-7-oxononanoate synthase, partial [Bacteroidota bacterium]